MGKFDRNCKRRDGFSAQDSESSTITSKKMKIQTNFASDEFTSPSHQQQLQDRRFWPALSPDNVTSSNCGGDFSSGDGVASRSFSIESDLPPSTSVDLESKSFETESSTCIDNKFSEDTTPPQNSDEMDPWATGGDQGCREKSQASKMPSQEEIDQFFEEAEKKAQKQFADKYNYDIAKDLPLEGRYQWVSLKP